MFSLILAPLVIGVCLHSSLAETDPHVFIIARDAESHNQASLVILGAVESVNRMEPPGRMMMMMMMMIMMMVMLISACSGDLSGPLETRCDQLTNQTTNQPLNLSGFILLLNLTRLKCRLLMEVCLASVC